MQTGLNKNRLKLTGTENSQAANVCITAVEGHSSKVLGVILILFSTITIVNLLMMGMVMIVQGGEKTPNSTHKVTTERATITLISFWGNASTTKGEDTKGGQDISEGDALCTVFHISSEFSNTFQGLLLGKVLGMVWKRCQLVMLALLHSAVPIKPENQT